MNLLHFSLQRCSFTFWQNQIPPESMKIQFTGVQSVRKDLLKAGFEGPFHNQWQQTSIMNLQPFALMTDTGHGVFLQSTELHFTMQLLNTEWDQPACKDTCIYSGSSNCRCLNQVTCVSTAVTAWRGGSLIFGWNVKSARNRWVGPMCSQN